jgi:hypothetical protein
MKKIFRFTKKLLLFIVLILANLLVVVNLTIPLFSHEETKVDYSNWMRDTLDGDKRIIDIAMLGAHDAMTNEIDYFSKLDVTTADSIQTGITGLLIRGFSVKQSKTQVSDTLTLLEQGVRYFDIRLTYNQEKEAWYTAHTYFSTPFDEVLSDIKQFLDQHPGEFLILDIQHVNGVSLTNSEEYEPAFQQIEALFEESQVLEHAYSKGSKELNQITYHDITSNQAKAGVMIITKLQNSNPSFWSYGASIRSAWPNTDQIDEVVLFLDEEALKISLAAALTGNQLPNNTEAVESLQGFRVMQAVLTMKMNPSGIYQGIMEWSLLRRARNFNAVLIDEENFDFWLIAMPIVMVDYSNTNHKDFLDKVMTKIIDYNQK